MVDQKCSESYTRSFTPVVNAIAEVESDHSATWTWAITATKIAAIYMEALVTIVISAW